MNKDVLTIIKKEFARFFGDKRLFFTSVLMPGLLIFVMYTFMGKGMMNSFETSDDYVSKINVVDMPESVMPIFDAAGVEVKAIDRANLDNEISKIKADEIDAVVVFPEEFDKKVEEYDITSGEVAPNVGIYYNSADKESASSYQIVASILDMYENGIANKFDINASADTYDQATEKDTTGMIFSMIMPLLLMIFLYSGCMAVAPDSIAGEKERGTIATLLVTPIKRSSLAWGKIISLSVFSLLSGISSFIGTMLSMPALMGGDKAADNGLSASVYGAKEYVLLLAIILSTVLVFTSVLAVISAFAKSVKEAGTLILPFMLLIMGLGIGSMMGTGKEMSYIDCIIPIYGTSKAISGIFAFNYTVSSVLIVVGVNIIVSVLLTVVLTKMFSNEKIMFSN